MDPNPLIHMFAPPEMRLAAGLALKNYFSAVHNNSPGKIGRHIRRTNKRGRPRELNHRTRDMVVCLFAGHVAQIPFDMVSTGLNAPRSSATGEDPIAKFKSRAILAIKNTLINGVLASKTQIL